MQKMKITHYPLSDGAKTILVAALIIDLIATVFFADYYPAALSTGAVNESLLIVPGIFLGVFVLILLLLRFRYALLENYPYLVNLPAFAYRLGIQTNPKRAGVVINRVFTVHALAALYTSIFYLTFSLAMHEQNFHFVPHAIFGLVVVFVLTVFVQYWRIYRSFAGS
ncbi:MAG: hypothetical protein KGH59_00225 [Candidatus Micrarchaeota archaeon]|nr:hypothetical protein [Candidatus Micrarchaeota archaeon]